MLRRLIKRSREARADPQQGRPVGAPTRAPLGSLQLERGFFHRHPAFLETSETSAFPWRLNLRHEAIFTGNATLLRGARVLDIASHDGRWSLAALRAGADHVTGVEARPALVEQARRTLESYDVTPERFDFEVGDVFGVLARSGHRYDVVLCLGFMYHTLRHVELLARFRATAAHHLIIDTEVHRGSDATIGLATEHIAREGNAVSDEFSVRDTVITGRPTLSALELLASSQGYELLALADWDGLLRDNPEADQVRDYRVGRRLTATFAASDRPR